MKTRMFNLLFLLGIIGFTSSCSSSEEGIQENAPLEELVMDDGFVGEKWDGEGIPSWLRERFFDFQLYEETHWGYENYLGTNYHSIYKFTYNDNLLVALSYYRFGGGEQGFYLDSGTLCYTDEGKRVEFNHVKDQFEQTAELIYPKNGEYIPQVSKIAPDLLSLDWIQPEINRIYAAIQVPEKMLAAMGLTNDDTHNYIVLIYDYWDRSNLTNGLLRVENIYTLDGEKKNELINDIKYKNICLHAQQPTWLIVD